MLISIKYDDNTYDLVKGFVLDELIESGKIKQFYRYSEAGWVVVGRDQIRGTGGQDHSGPERRGLKGTT